MSSFIALCRRLRLDGRGVIGTDFWTYEENGDGGRERNGRADFLFVLSLFTDERLPRTCIDCGRARHITRRWDIAQL